MTMDVQDIVAKYLKEYGLDGLRDFNGECCCEVDDMAPCGEMRMTCKAGYKKSCDYGDRCDFHIVARRHVTEADLALVREVTALNKEATARGLSITACLNAMLGDALGDQDGCAA